MMLPARLNTSRSCCRHELNLFWLAEFRSSHSSANRPISGNGRQKRPLATAIGRTQAERRQNAGRIQAIPFIIYI